MLFSVKNVGMPENGRSEKNVRQILNKIFTMSIQVSMLCSIMRLPVSAKQHGNSPYACNTDKRIDNSRKQCCHAAEQRCNEIKSEQPDQSPVQTADNHQSQC